MPRIWLSPTPPTPANPKNVAVLPLVDEGTEYLTDSTQAATVHKKVETFFSACGCPTPDDTRGVQLKDFESNPKWDPLEAPEKALIRRTVAYLKSTDTHAMKKSVKVDEYDLDQFDALEKNDIVSIFKDKILRTMRPWPMAANEVFVTLEKGSIKAWSEIADPDGTEVWPTEDDLRDAIREVLRQRKHAKPQPEKPKEVPQVPVSSYAPYTPVPQTQVYNYAPVPQMQLPNYAPVPQMQLPNYVPVSQPQVSNYAPSNYAPAPQMQLPNYAPVPQMQLPNYVPVLQPQVPNYAPVPQTQGIVRQVPLGVGGIVKPGYNAGYNGGLLRSVSFEGGGAIGGGVIGGASYGGTPM